MQGTILNYDDSTHTGFISGHDGKRYTFTKIDLAGKEKIKEGLTIDFDVDESDEKKAKDIIVVKPSSDIDKKKGKSWPSTATLCFGVLTLFYGFGVSKDAAINGEAETIMNTLLTFIFIFAVIGFAKKIR